MVKRYIFKVYLAGEGKTIDEAWGGRVEHFIVDPNPPVEDYVIED